MGCYPIMIPPLRIANPIGGSSLLAGYSGRRYLAAKSIPE